MAAPMPRAVLYSARADDLEALPARALLDDAVWFAAAACDSARVTCACMRARPDASRKLIARVRAVACRRDSAASLEALLEAVPPDDAESVQLWEHASKRARPAVAVVLQMRGVALAGAVDAMLARDDAAALARCLVAGGAMTLALLRGGANRAPLLVQSLWTAPACTKALVTAGAWQINVDFVEHLANDDRRSDAESRAALRCAASATPEASAWAKNRNDNGDTVLTHCVRRCTARGAHACTVGRDRTHRALAWLLACNEVDADDAETVCRARAPLSIALLANDAEIARELIAAGAHISRVEKLDNTPMWLCAVLATAPCEDALGVLGEMGARVSAGALRSVAAKGKVAAMRRLIALDSSNVNTVADFGECALHAAVAGSHDDVVRLLLAHGADPNACCPWNGDDDVPAELARVTTPSATFSALTIAVIAGASACVVQALLRAGANADCASTIARSALPDVRRMLSDSAATLPHRARKNDARGILRTLAVVPRARIDEVDERGDSALLVAIENSVTCSRERADASTRIAHLLLELGANPRVARARDGTTALHLIGMHANDTARARELIQRLGANAPLDLEARDHGGETPLVRAIRVPCAIGVRVLLWCGARVNEEARALTAAMRPSAPMYVDIQLHDAHTKLRKRRIDRTRALTSST